MQNLQSVDLSNLHDVMGKIANFLDGVGSAIGLWSDYRGDLAGGVDY